MKRIWTLVTVALVLTLCVVLLPVQTRAAESASSGTCGASGTNLTWSLVDGVLTISGSGDMDEFDESMCSVMGLSPWYMQKDSIRQIVIEEGVTSIGSDAFYCCVNLRGITIPASVKSIGNYAISTCKNLTDVYYGGTREQWEAISVHSTNGALNSATLHHKKLESVASGTCGEKLTWTLDNLGTLNISGTGAMENWVCMEDAFELSDVKMPPWFEMGESVKTIVIGEGVTSIGSAAFHSCALTEITIPDSVSSIGNYAFANCTNLKSIDISESVKEVGESAFENCTGLVRVSVSAATKNINNTTFRGCTSLTYQTYNYANYIGNESNPYEFLMKALNTDLTQCTIHPDTKVIAEAAFKDLKKLRTVTIPEQVTRIEWGAFAQCTSLREINIPGSVTCIGEAAFYNCTSMATLKLAAGLEEIGQSAFYNCDKLYSVSLPAGLKSLGSQAFYDCDGLTLVGFPDTVTEIGVAMFEGCDKLKYNTYDYGYYLGSNTNLYFLFVKTQYTDIKECKVFPSTKFISRSAFEDCTRLEKVELPSGLIGIQNDAFRDCTSLKEITIPEGITEIRYSLFQNCTNLTSVTIPASVTGIDSFAFWKCDNLKNVYYGGSKADWEKVDKSYNNDGLENATIHYAKHSHEWGAGVITRPATCAQEGVKTFTCICGMSRTESIDKLKTHTPGAPATETTDQICTVCGIVLKKATGVTEPTVPPTEETVPPTEETVPPTEETVPPTEETVPPTTEPVLPETEPTTEPTVQPTDATEPTSPPAAAPTEPAELEEPENSYLWIIAVVAVVLLGGAAAGIFLWKKKK